MSTSPRSGVHRLLVADAACRGVPGRACVAAFLGRREDGQGRAEGPPEGEALTVRSVVPLASWRANPAQGFVVELALFECTSPWTMERKMGRLQVPRSFGGGSAEDRVPVIPTPLRGRHGAVRPQPGGLNQAGDLAGWGVMTIGELAPWLRPIRFTRPPRPGSGCDRRAGRRRRG